MFSGQHGPRMLECCLGRLGISARQCAYRQGKAGCWLDKADVWAWQGKAVGLTMARHAD